MELLNSLGRGSGTSLPRCVSSIRECHTATLRFRARRSHVLVTVNVCHGDGVVTVNVCHGDGVVTVNVCHGDGVVTVNVCHGDGVVTVNVCHCDGVVTVNVCHGDGVVTVNVCHGDGVVPHPDARSLVVWQSSGCHILKTKSGSVTELGLPYRHTKSLVV